ncbi:MAG: D-alanine--D-alanine ligase family protein [Thermoanaerobaculia bacterium]
MTRVGLVFGGRSVEHKVSIVSARTVAKGLVEARHEVVPLGVAEDGGWVDPAVAERALAGDLDVLESVGGPVAPTLSHLLAAEIDVVFPIIHGTWGEDGTLQGLCEMLDLPYVGPGVTASAVAMDKLLCKRVLAFAGVPVVPFEPISAASWSADREAALARCERLPLPLFVKPSVGGSSVGIRKVPSRACLESSIDFAFGFDDTVLVEQGIEGRELECSVLGDETLEASCVGEIVPGHDFYDYADKYLEDTARLVAPADLPPETEAHIRELAVRAFEAIGGWGMARVDFLLSDAGDLYLNELNTLPGFTAISMYPRLWSLSGLPLPNLVDRLVSIALARHACRIALDRSIKEFLASLQ